MKKSKEEIEQISRSQLLTYLKLSGHRLGFLGNWNVPLIKDGVKRMVNGVASSQFLALFASLR
jgi:hypothetical protein